MYSLAHVPIRGWTWILMCFSHQTMAAVKRQIMAIISELDWNVRTVSVSECQAHHLGVSDPKLCTTWLSLSPGRSQNGAECHCLGWLPGCKCSSLFHVHCLESDHMPPRWLLWVLWTKWGKKNGKISICQVEVGAEMWHSEKSSGFTTAVMISA